MIMASKLMSRNSDLKRKLSTASSSDFFFTTTTTTTASSSNHNTKSEINYLDVQNQTQNQKNRTSDDVWNDILEGKKKKKQPKEEMIMTLEDYLVNAGALVVDVKEEQHKQYHDDAFIGISDNNNNFNISTSLSLIEPLDKVSQQRQRRMIKNRESAARSRERKQAYQVELESMAMRLEEENEQLLKEKEERTKKRLKQLLENVIPVVEKRKPPRVLRKVRSMQW